MKKNLIYTIASREYISMFLYFYKILKLKNNIDNLDIILITDENGKSFLENLNEEFKNVKIFLADKRNKFISPPNTEWKFKIFQIIDKNLYDNILFCDVDCLINLDLNNLFKKCISFDKFYALQTDKYTKLHKDSKYWFYEKLNDEQLSFLDKNNYFNVNIGVFMFKANSNAVYEELNKLLLCINDLDHAILEQAIFNSKLNLENKMNGKYFIEKLDEFVKTPPFKGQYDFILHFIHPHWEKDLNLPPTKIESMKIVYDLIKDGKI
jgi:hypothetical protein